MAVPLTLSEVPNVLPYIQYVAALNQTVYPYPFPITQDADLVVIINGITQAVDSTYSLTGQGNDTGGNVTLNTGSNTGDIITLFRNVPIERITQIAQNSGFTSTAFNAEFNNIYLILQQLEESIMLCLQIPNTNNPSPTTVLTPANYANKYLAFDAFGNPTPAILTSSGAITQAMVGSFINPRTTVEISLGVVPTNFQYPAGYVDRYATNMTPGTTDMTAAFQTAVNVARAGPGVDVVWGPTAPYMLSNTIDCTFGTTAQQYGLTFRQQGNPGVNLPTSISGGLYINHNKNTCFDLTGCSEFAFYDLTAVTNNGGTYPKTMFLTARNSHGESNFPRFFNTKVVGFFSVGILYNYGSEDGVYLGNVWENSATDAGAGCVIITSNNLWQGNAAFMSSAFVTIATGAQSTIGHTFEGGDYAVLAASTTGDVFYLEGGVYDFRFSDGWMACSNASTNGRSYARMDCTNGAPARVKFDSIHGEVSATFPQYGWDISNTGGALTAVGWSMRDCFLPTNTYAIHSPNATLLVSTLVVSNMTEQGTKGINIAGTLEDSTIDYEGTIVLGTSLRNILIASFANLTITTRTDDIILDRSTGGIYARGGIGLWGSAPQNPVAGWGTPTGAPTPPNNLTCGAGASLTTTSEAVGQLIITLKAVGILAA